MPNKNYLITSNNKHGAFIRAVCGVCLWVFAHTSAANSTADYQKSINKMAKEISAITKNLNANKGLVKSQREELFATERSLIQQSKELEDIERQLKNQELEISSLDKKMKTVISGLDGSKQALKSLMLAEYKNGNANYLKLLLNQQNPYAVGRLNNYQQYFSKELNAKFVELNQQLDQINSLQEQQSLQRNELVQQQSEYNKKIKTLQVSKDQRAKIVAKLDKKITTSSEKLEKIKQDRQRLRSLLKQIKIKAAELAKAEKERAKQQSASKNTASKPKRTLVAGGFKKQKGRLAYPVNIKHSTAFGARLPETGMRSDGMFFNTDKSVNVKSIFRGNVLFADVLKGYGLLLIIDHGDEHISLYGHNKVIYKKVGDSVETNETVSQTGVTGGLKKTGLYFEIRNNATPINPALWCQ